MTTEIIETVATAVRVKALEWTKHPSADMWRCDTIVGLYQVSSIVSPASWTFDGLLGKNAGGLLANAAEAKAAAQADYERRILSALEGAPAPAPEASE